MSQDRTGIFSGENPFTLAMDWLEAAKATEINDPNAIALSTVDADGMPNVRIVLLKEIEPNGFVFYTNFESQKGRELLSARKAAFVMHWKSLGRQVRARGRVEQVEAAQADAYYNSRALGSRIGAWASEQSRPLAARADLEAAVTAAETRHGDVPKRPPFWGGFRLIPSEMEFWANGDYRLHDRFRWSRDADGTQNWDVQRLNP